MMALRSPLATCAASAVAAPRRANVQRSFRAARLVVRAEQQQVRRRRCHASLPGLTKPHKTASAPQPRLPHHTTAF